MHAMRRRSGISRGAVPVGPVLIAAPISLGAMSHSSTGSNARCVTSISVTDRCNFRCTYCMPKELFGKDHQFLPASSC